MGKAGGGKGCSAFSNIPRQDLNALARIHQVQNLSGLLQGLDSLRVRFLQQTKGKGNSKDQAKQGNGGEKGQGPDPQATSTANWKTSKRSSANHVHSGKTRVYGSAWHNHKRRRLSARRSHCGPSHSMSVRTLHTRALVDEPTMLYSSGRPGTIERHASAAAANESCALSCIAPGCKWYALRDHNLRRSHR